MAEQKDRLDKINYNFNFNPYRNQNRWITQEKFQEWAQEHDLITLLFRTGFHEELLKQSNPLLQFLYNRGQIDNHKIEFI